MRIALVEDNRSLAQGIATSLRDLGHAVDLLEDGAQADVFLRGEMVDLAILDVNLPGLSGLAVLRALRARGDATPVLMLTAMGKTSERVAGLDAGADDYLVKPFETAELVARIRALARRTPQLAPSVEALGAFSFDRATRQLRGPEGAIELPRREVALLELLLDRRGRLIGKEGIIAALYGVGADIDANAVESLVSRLRRKLAGAGVTIRTARGLGYMLDDGPA